MPLSLNTPTSVTCSTDGTYSVKYLPTGSNSGVFIDVNMQSFGDLHSAHPGVAFFCNGVPSPAVDSIDGQIAWSGTASGVIFRPDGRIERESWLGGSNNFVLGQSSAPGTWRYGVIYRVTATWNGGNVGLAVYATDNRGNVTSLVFSEVVPDATAGAPTKLKTKGTHAAVFAAHKCSTGTCPIALYP